VLRRHDQLVHEPEATRQEYATVRRLRVDDADEAHHGGTLQLTELGDEEADLRVREHRLNDGGISHDGCREELGMVRAMKLVDLTVEHDEACYIGRHGRANACVRRLRFHRRSVSPAYQAGADGWA